MSWSLKRWHKQHKKLLAEYEKDPETRQKMCLAQAQQFCWDKAVDEYINYYLDILKEK